MSGYYPPPAFALTDYDKVSSLWLRLKDHLLDRLAAARLRNDEPRTEQETATLRGEIRIIKRLLALGDDRPMTGEDDQPLG